MAGQKRMAVFAIIPNADGQTQRWLKVGSAFANRDGSISMYLDAFPVGTNKLQIREERPRAEAAGASAEAPRDGVQA